MYIIDIRLLKSNFVLNYDSQQEDQQDFDVDLSVRTNYDREKNEATVILKSKTNSEDYPVFFDIEYGGKFKLQEDEEAALKRLYTINCPAIILPYLREYLADITRRAGLKPFYIQPINFVEASRHADIKDLSKDEEDVINNQD